MRVLSDHYKIKLYSNATPLIEHNHKKKQEIRVFHLAIKNLKIYSDERRDYHKW